MSDDQHIEITGRVIESCKGSFKIKVNEDQIINARLSGKMKKNKINVVEGDMVKVKVSVYDLTNGFIVRRN